VDSVSAFYDLGQGETTTLLDNTRDKGGADHLIYDHNFSLEPAKSTTVRFIGDLPISAKAAVVPGVARAKSLTDANRLLRPAGIDLFGNARKKDGSLPSPSDQGVRYPTITFRVETSHDNSFDTQCGFSQLESDR
jgi:hypothetical protein